MSYFRQRILDGVWNLPQIGSGRLEVLFRARGPSIGIQIFDLPQISLPQSFKIEITPVSITLVNNEIETVSISDSDSNVITDINTLSFILNISNTLPQISTPTTI